MKGLIVAAGAFVAIWALLWMSSSKPTDGDLAQIQDCEALAPVVDLDSGQGKRVYYSFMVSCLPDVYPPKAHMKAWLNEN